MLPQEVKELIGQKNVFLVDVRSSDEFKSGHIKDAQNIPLQNIQNGDAENEIPSKDATIIVYCQSGARSMIACELLKRQGYLNSHDFGSIMKWPYDIV